MLWEDLRITSLHRVTQSLELSRVQPPKKKKKKEEDLEEEETGVGWGEERGGERKARKGGKNQPNQKTTALVCIVL